MSLNIEVKSRLCDLVFEAVKTARLHIVSKKPPARGKCAQIKELNDFTNNHPFWQQFIRVLSDFVSLIDEPTVLEIIPALNTFMWSYGPNPLIFSTALEEFIGETDLLDTPKEVQLLLTTVPLILPEQIFILMGSSYRVVALLAARRAREEYILPLYDLGIPERWKPIIRRGLDVLMTRLGDDKQVVHEINEWIKIFRGTAFGKSYKNHLL